MTGPSTTTRDDLRSRGSNAELLPAPICEAITPRFAGPSAVRSGEFKS